MNRVTDDTPVALGPPGGRRRARGAGAGRRRPRRGRWVVWRSPPSSCSLPATTRQLPPGVVDRSQRPGAPRRRHRRDGRRAVRRRALAAAGRPARPRRRAVAAGVGPARRRHRRQPSRATASPRPRRRRPTSPSGACRPRPSSSRTAARRATSRWRASPRLLAERGLDDVLIVTDPYHALRSRLIAEDLGLRAHVSPTPTTRRRRRRAVQPPARGGRRRRHRAHHRLRPDLTPLDCSTAPWGVV